MAHDPVLALHRALPRRYELSAMRTGSLRDQMLRATLLVDRLLDAGEIAPNDPDRGLIVIGCGPAGGCAALAAALQGVKVDVIEPVKPFHVQYPVTTRWIDPVEFDFPHRHWRSGEFPVPRSATAPPLPWPFKAGIAARLARSWSRRLGTYLAMSSAKSLPPGYGELRLIKYAASASEIHDRPALGPGVPPGLLWKPPGFTPVRYGAAIACLGLGQEDVNAPKGGAYVGYLFWARDRIRQLYKYVPGVPHPTRPQVLISGSGDGAQQDFLQATTGLFGKRLFDRLGLKAAELPLAQVLQLEDECRRWHAWRAPGSPAPTQLYRRWHMAYRLLARNIWREWQKNPAHLAALGSVLLEVDVTWVVKEAEPGHCYGLNRLLCLLVARLHAHFNGRRWFSTPSRTLRTSGAVMRTRTEVQHLVPSPGPGSHTCGTAGTCFGAAHQVTLSDAPASPQAFDVIIVRHGMLRPLPSFFGGIPFNEQMVPYSLG